MPTLRLLFAAQQIQQLACQTENREKSMHLHDECGGVAQDLGRAGAAAEIIGD
jgi:hypothetical protein